MKFVAEFMKVNLENISVLIYKCCLLTTATIYSRNCHHIKAAEDSKLLCSVVIDGDFSVVAGGMR